MLHTPLPPNEPARLLDLARYEILDSLPEEAFDRLTRLAARTLRAPAAIINFVDQDRQWGKSCFGTGDSTAPREASFCAWTILSDDVLVVEDTWQDRRFQNNSQVINDPFIRGYAGAPLITSNGYRIGSICVISSQPQVLDAADCLVLKDLASLVVDALELRVWALELQREVKTQTSQLQTLKQGIEHAQTLEAINGLLGQDLTPEHITYTVAHLIGTAIHADWTGSCCSR